MYRSLARLAVIGALSSSLAACGAQQGNFFANAAKPSAEQGGTVRIEPVWQFAVRERGDADFRPVEPSGIAVARSGVVVVAAFSGLVFGLDQVSGQQRWSIDLQEPPGTPPTAVGDTVFLGVADGRVVSLSAINGEERWSTKLSHIVHGQPTVADGVVYVMTAEEAVVALSESTGEVLWTYRHPRTAELEIRGGARPTLIDDHLYIGFSDGSFYKLTLEGKLVWASDLSRNHRRMVDVDSTPVAYGNLIIAASHTGGMSAVHRDNGRIQWTVERTGFTSPLLVEDTLIASTASGSIFWIDPLTGRELQELVLERPGLTSPMRFTENTFVVTDIARGVFVLDTRKPGIHAVFEPAVGISAQSDFYQDMLFVLTNRGTVYGLKATLR